MKRIYAIGIGGSGAKCLEAAIFLHGLGMFGDSRLGTLLIDADASNGNSQRTQINLRNTLDCHRVFKQGESSFMSGEFEDYGVWNPLSDVIHSSNLERIFNRQSLNATAPPLAKLFDTLYSPDEQTADLGVGFRGRPPIGSVVMSRLELTDLNGSQGGAWQRLFNNIQIDLGSGDEVSIHLFGSVFGGTGASGAPTLATLISNHLQQAGIRNAVHLNASLLLPYFGFEKPKDGEQTVFAETRFFALNTQAALQFLTEHSDGVFDTVYLVGNQDKEIYESHTGGTRQQNNAHFVELYAALAVLDGFKQPIGQTHAAYISRTNPENLHWADLPEAEKVKTLLAKGVRFAYSWLYNFSLELESARQMGAGSFAKGAPWFLNFFKLKSGGSLLPSVTDEPEKDKGRILDQWARGFLTWAQQLASSNRRGEQLFRLKDLNTLQNHGGYGEDLSHLVIDGAKSPQEQSSDRLDTFKNLLADQGKSPNGGVFGLVHSLYGLL
jgi:hypothetical protein